MSIPPELVALVIAIIVLAYIVQPFFSPRSEGAEGRGRPGRSILRQQADLLAERNRVYAALRDLEFEHQTNKLSDEDYAEQRYRLIAQGVELLQQLDRLPSLYEAPEDDPIEAAILTYRKGGNGRGPQVKTHDE